MAKLTELESRLQLEPLTKVGICFGTPQYMSPEQIRGKLDDKSIDLYAMAIIAYELITSNRPWDGDVIRTRSCARCCASRRRRSSRCRLLGAGLAACRVSA